MAINDHSQFHAQYNRPLTHTTYVCLYNMSLMFMFLQKKTVVDTEIVSSRKSKNTISHTRISNKACKELLFVTTLL